MTDQEKKSTMELPFSLVVDVATTLTTGCGDQSTGVSLLEEIIDDPNYDPSKDGYCAHRFLAEHYGETGRHKEAIDTYITITYHLDDLNDNDDVIVLFLLADRYTDIGDDAKATHYLERARERARETAHKFSDPNYAKEISQRVDDYLKKLSAKAEVGGTEHSEPA